MSSYISRSRAWFIAAAIVIAYEAIIRAVAAPSMFDRTNFLQYTFGRAEPMQRLFVFHKLKAFEYSNPTIVQSGDSSGFYGIEPSVVMKHLPKDVSYLNMSCCANLGFNGYYNIFEFMARRNPSMRYMVLHITPYTMPRPETWNADGANLWGTPGLEVFGDAVYNEFVAPRQIMHPPSLAYRRRVTQTLYTLPYLLQYRPGREGRPDRPVVPAGGEAPVDPLRAESEPYLEFLGIVRPTRGWMPESDVRGGVYAAECEIPTPDFFNVRTLSRKTYLEEVFDSFAALAKRYDAILVIVFQPVACIFGTGKPSANAREIVAKFKRDHPDVEIPFPLIETWPADMFSVPAHVRREYTDRIGDRLGNAMAEIVARRGSAR
jgi:hypothetical protein